MSFFACLLYTSGDGVGLRKAARLLPEVFVLAGDARGRVGALEGEAAVGCAALPIRCLLYTSRCV